MKYCYSDFFADDATFHTHDKVLETVENKLQYGADNAKDWSRKNKMHIHYNKTSYMKKKVQVGKDQEKAQSEKDSHSKNRGGKKPNQQSGTYTMKHIVSRMSSYFPNRWPLSYLNLTKNMKTYIRRQQHKKF